MTNEEFYDAEIAPALLKLAQACQERDMAFLASVEYDPLTMGIGRTEFQPPDEIGKLSVAQRLTHWAARSQGNIDKLMFSVDRHAQKHGHSSVYLQLMGNKNVKYAGNEMVAITIMTPK